MATLDQAREQIEANGPPLPDGHPVADGKFHRYGPKKEAWYRLNEVVLRATGKVVIGGTFGYWSGDNENTQRIAMDWTGVTPEDRTEAEAKRRELEAQELEKKLKLAGNAANRARGDWAEATVDGSSPYIERKQITAPGLRYQADGTLLVPMVTIDGDSIQLVGLQKIKPDGAKRYSTDMAKKGACCPIGKVGIDDAALFVTEGYATGRSVRMATDDALAGYVAFDAGNIMDTVLTARAQHPGVHILICSDDDYQLPQRLAAWLLAEFKLDGPGVEIDGVERTLKATDGAAVRVIASWGRDARGVPFIEADARSGRRMRQRTFENTGIARATAAARAVGNASIVCPRFADRGEHKWTDFNDLHVQESLQAVKEQLAAAIMAALNQASTSAPASIPTPTPAKLTVVLDDAAAPPAAVDNVAAVPVKKKGGAAKAAAAGGKSRAGIDDEPENGELRWESHLSRSNHGDILPTLANVYQILTNSGEWAGVIAYEEFSGQVVKQVLPPFAGGELGEWSDMDDLRTTLWMAQKYGFNPRRDVVMDAVLLVADLFKFHVVRSYLNPLVWDGVARLDGWMIHCLGAADTEYNRRVGRKWLLGAVARIYRPGCKVDNVLILEGTQGLFKSTALKVLGGEWFTDAPFRLGDKDGYVVMRGKWIIELAELDSFNKAESNGAKQFFGQYVDRYRNFYGKRATDVPRQQVFAGTTNSDSYLKDETGNRRYWPVKATLIDIERLHAIRDQLWAEAVVGFNAGVEWWETADDHDLFVYEQEERYVGDAYTALIAEGLLGESETTMSKILGDILKLDIAKWTKPEQQRVGRCMVELGWVRVRGSKLVGGKRPWVYVKPQVDGAAAFVEVDDDPL